MSTVPAMSDDEFLSRFCDLSLPLEAFSHRGHLRIAWIYLQRSPLPEAIAAVCSGIARFAAHAGAATKFHHTMTEALVRLMAAGGASKQSLGWDDFLTANALLVSDARQLLARYYSPAQLASATAQQRFVPPDLRPLP